MSIHQQIVSIPLEDIVSIALMEEHAPSGISRYIVKGNVSAFLEVKSGSLDDIFLKGLIDKNPKLRVRFNIFEWHLEKPNTESLPGSLPPPPKLSEPDHIHWGNL